MAKGKDDDTKFFVRIMPSLDFSYENYKIEANNVINVRCMEDFKSSRSDHSKLCFWNFSTAGIFHNASQDEVYSAVMDNVVARTLSGSDVIVLGYGQSGTGKTLTMTGIGSHYAYRGIVPRLFTELFGTLRERSSTLLIRYKVSYIEVIGEELFDLLQTPPKKITAKEATVLPLNSEKSGLEFLFRGERQRKVTTTTYTGANCGHSIMTIYILSKNLLETLAPVKSTRLHVIDMAGIDSLKLSVKSSRDIGNSNKSKSFLEQVLSHLDNPRQHSFRNAVVKYLGGSLCKESVFRFVGHIRATREDLSVSLSSLRFGMKVCGLPFEKVHTVNRPIAVRRIETEQERIKYIYDQLELNAMLYSQPDYPAHENLCRARVNHLRRLTKSFIKGDTTELEIMSVVQDTISMGVFKEVYEELTSEYGPLIAELETRLEKQERRMNIQKDMDRSLAGSLSRRNTKSKSTEKTLQDRKPSPDSSFSVASKRTISKTGKIMRTSKTSSMKKGSILSSSSKHGRGSKANVTDNPIPKPVVREINRFGITIGPPILNGFQGDITLATKHCRNQQLPTVSEDKPKEAFIGVRIVQSEILKCKDLGVIRNMREKVDQNSFTSFKDSDRPIDSDVTVANLQDANENYKDYLHLCAEITSCRQNLEKARSYLQELVHNRQLAGVERVKLHNEEHYLREFIDTKAVELKDLEDRAEMHRSLLNKCLSTLGVVERSLEDWTSGTM